MKTKYLFLTSLAVVAATQLWAADMVRYEGLPSGSKVRMDGDSTLHKWYAESQLVSGFMEFEKDFTLESVKPGKVNAKVESAIPVRTLKCSSGNAMNNVMYDAMNVKKGGAFLKIEYRLKSLEAKAAGSAKGPVNFDSVGDLVVSGVTNEIKMPVTIESPAANQLLAKGSTKLKMTQFGIKPPTLTFLGVGIRTDDNIEVKFEWLTAKK